MPRRFREDTPDSWHHVFNRGIARRTVFELRSDVRFFLSRLAREVRSGTIEIHAYCFLTTHFHLLVRSLRGELSDALRRIQNAFVRHFNRERKRDGSLFRGRFGSVPIDTASYWQSVLGYIDLNAVDAGLVGDPRAFPHGSASHYSRPHGPIWLERSAVERLVCRQCESGRYDPDQYRPFSRRLQTPGQIEIVKRRSAGGVPPPSALDDLIDMATPEVLDWMRRKARLADGTHPGLTVVAAATTADVIRERRARRPDWTVRPGRKRVDAWLLVQIGLMRDACGLTYADIAQRCGRSTAGVQKSALLHRELLQTNEAYGLCAADVLAEAMDRDRGGQTRIELAEL